jgi:hypothetical protein
MKLTGHKTESVYRRYAIVSEADLAVAVGKVAALHSVRRVAIANRSGRRGYHTGDDDRGTSAAPVHTPREQEGVSGVPKPGDDDC